MQTTLAWGRNKRDPGEATDGYLLESALHADRATSLFARFERVANDELFPHDSPLHGQAFGVRKLSVGLARDLFSAGQVTFSAGALASKYWKPAALDAFYGASPSSFMVFFRAKLAPPASRP